MLYVRPIEGRVWLDSENETGKTHHLMAGSDIYDDRAASWNEAVAALPKLNGIINRYELEAFAMVSYSSNGLLSISFHTYEGVADFPERLLEAQEAIITELGIEVRDQDGNV